MAVQYPNACGAGDDMKVDGNVGIGTTTPDGKLDVVGGSIVQQGSGGIKAYDSDGGNLRLEYNKASGNALLRLYDASNNSDVVLHTADDSYFNGGNVGIGTNAPGQKLEVAGNVKISDGYLEMDYKASPGNPGDQEARLFVDRNQTDGTIGSEKYFPKLAASLTGKNMAGTSVSRIAPISTVEWFNVKDFGAVGDGSTDDTASINKAFAAARSFTIPNTSINVMCTVYFPKGKYKITATVTIPYSVSVKGDGPSSVWLYFPSITGSAAIQWGSGTGDLGDVSEMSIVEGFTLEGSGKTNQKNGIDIGGDTASGRNLTHAVLRDVVIGYFERGIKAQGHDFCNMFSHVWIKQCNVGYEDISNLDYHGERITFLNCTFDSNNRHLYVVPGNGGGVEYLFKACSFDYATSYPEATLGGADQIVFDYCRWETSQVGSDGDALLVDITSPIRELVFRSVNFQPQATIEGTPVQWNTSASTPADRHVTFYDCVGMDTSPSFYSYGVGGGVQPNILVVGCKVSANSGQLTKIDADEWILEDGSVGIGTTSPNAKLDVRGSVIINEDGADNDVRIEGDTDANLLVTDASADRVGIGTATPPSKLTVVGAAVAGESAIKATNSNTTSDSGMKQLAIDTDKLRIGASVNNSGYGAIGSNGASAGLSFVTHDGTSWAERVTFAHGGQVGIGTTSPNEKLEVEGKIRVGTSTNKANIEAGTGNPSHPAPKGTLYMRTDATGSQNRLWVNTDGSTTWAYVTTNI